MIKLRLKYLRKLAGRIKVEQYYQQINKILDMVSDYFEDRTYLTLNKGQSKTIGTVNFNINNKNIPLEIEILFDPDAYFGASIEQARSGNIISKLVVNLGRFESSNNIKKELMPIVYHEITHFIDIEYQPQNQYKIDEDKGYLGENTKFYEDAVNISEKLCKLDFGNLKSFNKQSIEKLVRRNIINTVKSKEFNNLLKKYNLNMSHEIFGKLSKIIFGIYLQTMQNNFSNEDNIFNAQVMYYNSELEIRAHINEIIQEIRNNFIHKPIGTKLLQDVIDKKINLSSIVDRALSSSNQYKEISKYLYPKNLQLVNKEIGRFLIDELSGM